MESQVIVTQVRRWLQDIVVGFNLCPFAGRELLQERVRFKVSGAARPEQLLATLLAEVQFLQANPATETTLLIHPNVLQVFSAYNQFLDVVDALLDDMGLQGEFQVASFHPQYQFADTDANDPENYTNRAPYPMLHILRESSVEKVIGSHPDVDSIPQRNIELMRSMGPEKLRMIFADLKSARH